MDQIADSFVSSDQSSIDKNSTENKVLLCDARLKGLAGTFDGTAALREDNGKKEAESLIAGHSFFRKMPTDICEYGNFGGTSDISIQSNGNKTVYMSEESIPDFYAKTTRLTLNKESGTITFDSTLKRGKYFMGIGEYA